MERRVLVALETLETSHEALEEGARLAAARGAERRLVVESKASVLVLHRSVLRRRPVIVLYQGNTAALRIGAELAQAHGADLEVLIGRDEPTRDELEQTAATWMEERGIRAQIGVFDMEDVGRLAEQVSTDTTQLAVVDGSRATLGHMAIDRVLDRLDVPVCVAK